MLQVEMIIGLSADSKFLELVREIAETHDPCCQLDLARPPSPPAALHLPSIRRTSAPYMAFNTPPLTLQLPSSALHFFSVSLPLPMLFCTSSLHPPFICPPAVLHLHTPFPPIERPVTLLRPLISPSA